MGGRLRAGRAERQRLGRAQPAHPPAAPARVERRPRLPRGLRLHRLHLAPLRRHGRRAEHRGAALAGGEQLRGAADLRRHRVQLVPPPQRGTGLRARDRPAAALRRQRRGRRRPPRAPAADSAGRYGSAPAAPAPAANGSSGGAAGSSGANGHASRNGAGARRPEDEWRSDADRGWQAARSAAEPIAGGLTSSGLPKRVPKANLVPGTAPAPEHVKQVPTRSADRVRNRFSGFQRGIREGRSQLGGQPGEDDK